METNFTQSIKVQCKIEKLKTGNVELSYVSWANAWQEFKKIYTDGNYEIVTFDGLPYQISTLGIMVYTKVTAGGVTHTMWLPVLDGANMPLKTEEYTYQVWDKYTKKYVDKKCKPVSIFDINTSIMRCLTKNIAMFGIGLYVYAGEDLPVAEEHNTAPVVATPVVEKEKVELKSDTPFDVTVGASNDLLKKEPELLEICRLLFEGNKDLIPTSYHKKLSDKLSDDNISDDDLKKVFDYVTNTINSRKGA